MDERKMFLCWGLQTGESPWPVGSARSSGSRGLATWTSPSTATTSASTRFKEFTPTLLPGDVNGATVILVDDVLFSGRTVKAALDELFDHGRPARVELAVLVDRGSRKLPIVADFAGTTLDAAEGEDVIVSLGDDPSDDRIDIRARAPKAPRAAALR